jgi:hypothetical protein
LSVEGIALLLIQPHDDIPPRDSTNFEKLNALLADDLDAPLVPLGPRGENFIQTYQTQWRVLQFHLGVPGVPRFEEADAASVTRQTDSTKEAWKA